MKRLYTFLNSSGTKSRLIKDGMSSLIINGGNKIFVLLTGVLLVRILGKSEYGIYSYVLSLMYILVFPVEFGISNLLVRQTAQGMTQQDHSGIKGVWRWSFRISVLFSIAILILSALGSIWGKNHFSQIEMLAFFWVMVLLPFQVLVHVSSGALRGLKNVILGQVADLIIIPGLFGLLFIIFGFLTPVELNAASAMALRAAATFVAFLFTIIWLIQKTPAEVRNASPITSGKVWLISAFSLGMSSGFNMLKSHLCTLILGFFVDSGQIGSFQVAVSAAALSSVALQAVNTIIAPQFASLKIKNDMKNFQRLATTSSRIVSAFNLIIALIFIFFGKPILAFAFGSELVDAYPSLVILLTGQLVNSFAGSVAYILNMSGFEHDVVKVIGISTAINVFLTLALTPFLGILGAAIASAFTLIFSQCAMHRQVYKKLGIVSNAFGRVVFH